MALSPKRQLFVAEYMKDGNGTQAAIRAGYSPRTANEQAAQLLANLSVNAEVQRRIARKFERSELTAEKVLRELQLIAFSNIEDYITRVGGRAVVDISRANRDQMAAIQELTSESVDGGAVVGGEVGIQPAMVYKTKLKLAEKRGALELLGKHLKLWTDKYEHGLSNPLEKLIEAFNNQSGNCPPVPPTDAPAAT
jgi:phage terminase small subunit